MSPTLTLRYTLGATKTLVAKDKLLFKQVDLYQYFRINHSSERLH